MSIFSSLRYCLGDPDAHGNLWLALAFLPFGLFFDFLDGKVARWRNKSSMMGQELDSLADLVCCPCPIPSLSPSSPLSPAHYVCLSVPRGTWSMGASIMAAVTPYAQRPTPSEAGPLQEGRLAG